jgi:hypothetical protein
MRCGRAYYIEQFIDLASPYNVNTTPEVNKSLSQFIFSSTLLEEDLCS